MSMYRHHSTTLPDESCIARTFRRRKKGLRIQIPVRKWTSTYSSSNATMKLVGRSAFKLGSNLSNAESDHNLLYKCCVQSLPRAGVDMH
eukprot:scaffold86_cov338-Pavlova_lutheri.AAC.56